MKKKLLSLLLILSMMVSLFSSMDIVDAAKKATVVNTTAENTTDTCATGDSPLTQAQEAAAKEEFTQIESKEEMLAYLEEYSPNKQLPKNTDLDKTTNVSSVDNSTSSCFPQVRSQGGVGSCTAWANAYYQLTYELNRTRGTSAATTANQISPLFLYNMINGGVDTGSNGYTATQYLKQFGSTDYDLGPALSNYTSWSANEAAWTAAQENKIADIYEIDLNPQGLSTFVTAPDDSDLDALKTALASGDVLSFSTAFYTFTYARIQANSAVPANADYVSDYIISKCDNYITNSSGYRNYGWHRMTFVGYNDDIWVDINGNGIVENNEKGAFKIANSHGTNYKNDGFVWLSYDALNDISSVSGVPTTNRYASFSGIYGYTLSNDTDSKLYAKINLNTARRNQVRVTLTATKNSTVKTYSVKLFSNFNSTALAFDGTTTACDGTFVFDLNNVISDISASDLQDYTWTVTVQDTTQDSYPLTVKEISILNKNNTKTYSAPITTGTLNGTSATYTVNTLTEPNLTTIYYQGFSPAYIHYKIGNGDWTNVPGIAMTPTTEQEGYSYKATINLNTAQELTACFNNGSGSWDSDNGNNYTFGVGTYGYCNGTIVELEDEDALRVTSFETSEASPLSIAGTTTLSAEAAGGTAPYTYRFGSILNNTERYISDYSSSTETLFRPAYLFGAAAGDAQAVGTHTLFVDVKDATGAVVRRTIQNYNVAGLKITSLTTNLASPQKVGTTISIAATVENEASYRYNSYNFYVIKDGVTTNIGSYSNHYSTTWTPTEAGTYTIGYTLSDYLGQTATQTMTYVINEDNTNETTIYYNGFSPAYIHYKIGNGNWTNVPGIPMPTNTELSGYTHKITIDLGDATTLTACFNDGNGNWDSAYGANYCFGVGTYTYSNGTITKID